MTNIALLLRWMTILSVLVVVVSVDAVGKPNRLAVDVDAAGHTHDRGRLMRMDGKELANLTLDQEGDEADVDRSEPEAPKYFEGTVMCHFTMDNIVEDVYYGDTKLEVQGTLNNWNENKVISFKSEGSKWLTFTGRNLGWNVLPYPGKNAAMVSADKNVRSRGACKTGGFAIKCRGTDTHFETQDLYLNAATAGWSTFGSAQAIDATHRQGLGTGWQSPCTSPSGMSLPVDRSSPLIAASDNMHSAFRFQMPSLPVITTTTTLTVWAWPLGQRSKFWKS
jgi:hypothetical protein